MRHSPSSLSLPPSLSGTYTQTQTHAHLRHRGTKRQIKLYYSGPHNVVRVAHLITHRQEWQLYVWRMTLIPCSHPVARDKYCNVPECSSGRMAFHHNQMERLWEGRLVILKKMCLIGPFPYKGMVWWIILLNSCNNLDSTGTMVVMVSYRGIQTKQDQTTQILRQSHQEC